MGSNKILLNPIEQLEDSISLITNDKINFNAFIVNDKNIHSLENTQAFFAMVPDKSNLRKIDNIFNKKFRKMYVNHEEFEYTPNDEPIKKKIITDKFGKVFFMKEENEQGLKYDLRLDLVIGMMNAGYNLIQCNQKNCDWYKPQSIKIDLNNKMV